MRGCLSLINLNILWTNENLRRMLHSNITWLGKSATVCDCGVKGEPLFVNCSLSRGERRVSDISSSRKGGKYIKTSQSCEDEKGSVEYFLKLSIDVTEED